MANSLIAVAGFASAWMLLWGVVAAIPILLHYLYRRRQVAVPWAAVQLLIQVIEKESKRINLEQWLLLVVRTLILLLFALSLARPFWTNEDEQSLSGNSVASTNWIIALDVSYSMGYRVDNQSRLQFAQARAIEIIEAANDGDAFALVALGRPPRAVVASPSFDRSAVIAEIGRLTIDDAGCDLPSGLQLIADIAQRAQTNETLPSNIRILLLSDLGIEHWQTAINGTDAKLLQALMAKFPFEVESLSDETVSNIAITEIRPSTSRAILDQPLEVDVTLKNYSDASINQLPVQLSLDGSTLASEIVELQPDEARTVRFSLTPTSLGSSTLTGTIPADRLSVDNTRHHAIEVRESYDILFVEQQMGDAKIIKLGLNPDRPISRPSRNSVSVLELPSIDLAKWHGIVLLDLASIDEALASRLENYVRAGGALICMWGPRTNAAQWNAHESRFGLLGFQFLDPTPFDPSAERSWNIDPLEYQSPVVAPFADFPDAGLLTTPIFRFWRIEPNSTKNSELAVDLATENRAPLIAHHRLGQGTVYSLLSTPQSGSESSQPWNAMATWPSFVPLMQRLVQSALDSGSQQTTLLAGQVLVGKMLPPKPNPLAPRAPTESPVVTIVRPDKSESQISVGDLQDDGTALWAFQETHQSGIYIARDASKDEHHYAVNVDGSESGLQSIAAAQLPKSPLRQSKLTDSPTATPNTAAESSPRVTRVLLVSLGLLLILESSLAWGLGRRER